MLPFKKEFVMFALYRDVCGLSCAYCVVTREVSGGSFSVESENTFTVFFSLNDSIEVPRITCSVKSSLPSSWFRIEACLNSMFTFFAFLHLYFATNGFSFWPWNSGRFTLGSVVFLNLG